MFSTFGAQYRSARNALGQGARGSNISARLPLSLCHVLVLAGGLAVSPALGAETNGKQNADQPAASPATTDQQPSSSRPSAGGNGPSGPAVFTRSFFEPIYTDADYERCGVPTDGPLPEGFSVPGGSLGLSPANVLEAAYTHYAGCLVKKWAGGRYWAFATVKLSGQRYRNSDMFTTGPIGILVQDYYSGYAQILGFDSKGRVLSGRGSGRTGPHAVRPGRIYVTATRKGTGEVVLPRTAGATSVRLPEGVFDLLIEVERPATPRSAAGFDVTKRVVVVRSVQNDRRSAYFNMQIVPPAGWAGTGMTISRAGTRSVVNGQSVNHTCDTPHLLSARAMYGEVQFETDLSLMSSSGAKQVDYAAQWTLKKSDGQVVRTGISERTFPVRGRDLADGNYVVEAAFQSGDLPSNNGLRFRPSPATFTLTINCTAPERPRPGTQAIGSLLIKRHLGGTGNQAYSQIQTNAERIEGTENRSGQKICQPATFHAFAKTGVFLEGGQVSYNALDPERKTHKVSWSFSHGEDVLQTGNGSAITIDPNTYGDGDYQLKLELAAGEPRGTYPPSSIKSIAIRGCGPRRKVDPVQRDKANTGPCPDGFRRNQLGACTRVQDLFSATGDEGTATVAPTHVASWFQDAEAEAKKKIESDTIAVGPGGAAGNPAGGDVQNLNAQPGEEVAPRPGGPNTEPLAQNPRAPAGQQNVSDQQVANGGGQPEPGTNLPGANGGGQSQPQNPQIAANDPGRSGNENPLETPPPAAGGKKAEERREKEQKQQHCANLRDQIKDAKEILERSCDPPRELMQGLYKKHEKYTAAKKQLIQRVQAVSDNAEAIVSKIPRQIKDLQAKAQKLLDRARRTGLIYVACAGGSPEIAPGIPADKLILGEGDVQRLKNTQEAYRKLLKDWDRKIFTPDTRKRYSAAVKDFEAAFRKAGDKLNAAVEDARKDKLKLYSLWTKGDLPHCIGPGPGRSWVPGIPGLPGMELPFVKAPVIKMPRILDLLQRNLPRNPDWRLDGHKYALALRDREEERVRKQLKQLAYISSGKGIAGGIGRKVRDNAVALYNLLHVPLNTQKIHKFEERLVEEALTPSNYYFGPQEIWNAGRKIFQFSMKFGRKAGEVAKDTASKTFRFIGRASEQEVYEKFNRAAKIGKTKALDNLAAYNILQDANQSAKAAVAEFETFISIEAFLLETIGGAALSKTGGAAAKFLKTTNSKRLQLGKELDKLEAKFGKKKIERIRRHMNERLSDDNLKTLTRHARENLSTQDAQAILNQSKTVQRDLGSWKQSRQADELKGLTEEELIALAHNGDLAAKKKLAELFDLDEAQRVAQQNLEDVARRRETLGRQVDELEADGTITPAKAAEMRDELGLAPSIEGGSATADFAREAVQKRYEKIAKSGGTLKVDDGAGGVTEIPLQGASKGGTAVVVFTKNGKALKISYSGKDFGEEIVGEALAKRNGIPHVKINKVHRFRDPETGHLRYAMERDTLDELAPGSPWKLGSTVKKSGLNEAGRLKPAYARAVMELMDTLRRKRVFWGDFKLDNIAFKDIGGGRFQAQILDTGFLKHYDEVARSSRSKPLLEGISGGAATDQRIWKAQLEQLFNPTDLYARGYIDWVTPKGSPGEFWKFLDPKAFDDFPQYKHIKKSVEADVINDPGGLNRNIGKQWEKGEPPAPKDPEKLAAEIDKTNKQDEDFWAEFNKNEGKKAEIVAPAGAAGAPPGVPGSDPHNLLRNFGSEIAGGGDGGPPLLDISDIHLCTE
ncbi:MAG: hypothetical protein AAF441_09185 [Pseudomonadota bacterium]